MTNSYTRISFLITLLIVFFAGISSGQESPPKITMNIGYNGNNFWKPGFNVGFDVIHGIENGNTRNGDTYIRHKFFNADFGFYADPGSHTGVFTHVGINHRKFREDQLNFNIGISPIGLYRSFLPEASQIDDNEEISDVPSPGRFYYAPVVTLGMGKFQNNRPGTGWFFEIDIMTLIPFNNSIKPILSTKLGWRMRIV